MSHVISKVKRPVKMLEEFPGVDPSGALDSLAGIQAAFNWLAGGNRKLVGLPGSTYKVSGSIQMFGKNVTFDGQECVFINAINAVDGSGNAAPADPMLSITAAGGAQTFLAVCNFTVQFDQPKNKGHTVAIIGNGNSPQVIAVRNVRPNYQIGLGKDRNGAAMSAYAVYAYGVYTLFLDENYAQNGSGGIFVDTVQKVSMRRNTIDSAHDYGMWFDNCASVFVSDMNNLTGCGQVAQSAVYFNNCEKFVFRDNRIKGGLGPQVRAGATPSRSVSIKDNHIEVYAPNNVAINVGTNIDALTIEDNYIKHIGGNGPFEAGVGVYEVAGGTQSRGALSIRRNKIMVGGADTLNNAIIVTTVADQVNSAVIEQNTIGDRNAVAGVITNGINMVAVGSQNAIRHNVIGSANVTVTNGIVLGVGQSSARIEGNQAAGVVTNMLVNNGTATRRYDKKDIVPVLKGKTTAGAHTYSQQSGEYRIVDDVVHFTVSVDLNTFDAAMNGWAAVEMDSTGVGMPKSKNKASQWTSVQLMGDVFTHPAGSLGARAFIQPNTSEVWFSFSMNNAAAILATQAHCNVNFAATISGTYIAG